MSLYFKVQSVPVMLLHDCAPGEFPHRSDDKRKPDSRVCVSVCACVCGWGVGGGGLLLTLRDIFWAKL